MNVPLIGIPANVRRIRPVGETYDYHGVAENFLAPLFNYLGFQTVIIPAFADLDRIAPLLDILDGVLLTGSDANIHPSSYGEIVQNPKAMHDEKRDAVTLPLIRHAVEHAVPLLGICRGMQEINIAFGGTLVQQLHAQPGLLEHRGWMTRDNPDDARSQDAHDVETVPGGLLHTVTGLDRFMVNSLHEQGIGRLGQNIAVEARASDNTIEAITVSGASAFTLGVLWHPEWFYDKTPASLGIFDAFRKAAWARMREE